MRQGVRRGRAGSGPHNVLGPPVGPRAPRRPRDPSRPNQTPARPRGSSAGHAPQQPPSASPRPPPSLSRPTLPSPAASADRRTARAVRARRGAHLFLARLLPALCELLGRLEGALDARHGGLGGRGWRARSAGALWRARRRRRRRRCPLPRGRRSPRGPHIRRQLGHFDASIRISSARAREPRDLLRRSRGRAFRSPRQRPTTPSARCIAIGSISQTLVLKNLYVVWNHLDPNPIPTPFSRPQRGGAAVPRPRLARPGLSRVGPGLFWHRRG